MLFLLQVLADSVGVPCTIVRGLFYTGSREGARVKIRDEAGMEFIVDIARTPGVLSLVTSQDTPPMSPIPSPCQDISTTVDAVARSRFQPTLSGLLSQGHLACDPDGLKGGRSLNSHEQQFGHVSPEPIKLKSPNSTGISSPIPPAGNEGRRHVSPLLQRYQRRGRRSRSAAGGWGSSQVPLLVTDVAKENPRFAQRLKVSGFHFPPSFMCNSFVLFVSWTGYFERHQSRAAWPSRC